MPNYTETLNTNYNFPNINIYNQYEDGVQYGYKAIPQEGYVMYSTEHYQTEPKLDEYGNEILDEFGMPIEEPVTYYYTLAGFPLNYNFANFPWIAVPRSEVDENYIFGVDEPEHEIM